MERKEQSPALSGWVGGGVRERNDVPMGTIVVPLADVSPSDIADSHSAHAPVDADVPDSDYAHADWREPIWHWVVTVEGTCARTTTTPTDRRRDALLSATRFVEAAKRIVRAEPGRVNGTVAHAIRQDGLPNGSDGLFVLHLELHDADPATIGRVYDRIATEAWTIGRLSATKLVITPHESNPSVLYDVRPQAAAPVSPTFSVAGERPAVSVADTPNPAQALRIG